MKKKNTSIFSFSGKVFSGLIFLVIILSASLSAQVQFKQTSNADFYKGNYNDLVVSNNAITLPLQANGIEQWLTTTVLPQTLKGHKTATWNNRFVYVSGGYNGHNCSNAVYRAALQSGGIGSYTSLSALPYALKEHAMVTGTNSIYVLGGCDDSEVFNTIHTATINTDGSLSEWQTLDVTLPVKLKGHTAVYCNGYIYLAGGSETLSGDEASNKVYFSQVRPDNTLTEFSSASDLPAALISHTMVTQGEKIVIMGGLSTGGSKVSTVYSAVSGVNGALSSWAQETNLPVAVSNHASVVINGLITVLAGEANGELTNTAYYANLNETPLNWTLAPDVMYDYTKDGAAFASNGQIGYCGGENNSGAPILNTRYANLGMSIEFEKNGLFISNPFYELGATRLITELSFDTTSPDGSDIKIAYRTAIAGESWGPWSSYSASNPLEVNENKQYLQYKVDFSNTGPVNGSFVEMRLFTPGSQLAGNLNHILTFSKAMSPYWATSDIIFTAGTHTFEAGSEILFLPGVKMQVDQANIICQGTVDDSVKFLGYTNTDGLWGGIYFTSNSDNLVSSQFHYTVIANGGYGDNNANLYCNGTNEPLLKNSSIRNALGNGIRLINAHINLENCTISKNAFNGLYLENANPTLLDCSITNNEEAGVFLTSTASVPTYHGTSISNNLYALRYPSPNFTFHEPNGLPVLSNNTYNGIAMDGGYVTSSSKIWNSISYDYILLGNVGIGSNPAIRLTIEPGNTIKVVNGANIQIGVDSPIWGGGELYAIGTADSTITFTSWNGTTGGWEGIYFQSRSDMNEAGPSVLDYVTIEKGNEYNYYAENTTSVHIKNSTIQMAVLDGAKYLNSFGYIEDCNFLNNGRYPLYLTDWSSNPVNKLNTYTGNHPDFIVLAGGTYTADRTLYFDSVPYWVQNDINVHGNWSSHRLFTVEPGVSLHFAAGKGLFIGYAGSSLIAEGTSEQPVTFTAYNGEAGGWNGIVFYNYSSSYGNSSFLNHCIIEKGNEYNIYSENNTEPNIENSTIQLAAGDGIKLFNSSPVITNSIIKNNGAYPIYNSDWRCNPTISGNQYTGNKPNFIALSGGVYTSDFTLVNDGVPYHVLDNIIVDYVYQAKRTLTLQPGIKLAFAPEKRLELRGSGTSYGSSLHATGTTDSIITFTAFNGEVGGWEGILFDRSGAWDNESTLKHCIIEKGNNYNIRINQTNQPTIENSIIRLAAQDGLSLSSTNIPIIDCEIISNGRYPLLFTNWDCSPFISGNTYSNNNPDYIAFPGGSINKNFTFRYDGVPYHVLGNIIVDYAYQAIRTLTLQPGVTLAFAPGMSLELKGSGTSYGSSLHAVGTADSVISFLPFNGEPGGWEGIYFDQSGAWGNESTMKHCIIEKGNNYNVRVNHTNQPKIENSIIRLAAQDGFSLTSANLPIINCELIDNGRYPLLFTNWDCSPFISGNTYSNNNPDYIAFPGGSINKNFTLRYDGIPYHVLDNIIVEYAYQAIRKLTVQPGVTLAFAPEKRLEFKGSGTSYGSSLFAVGTADSIITFTPFNSEVGGWEGIYFDRSGGASNVSTMKHCMVEKGNLYNIRSSETNQTFIESSIIQNALQNGLVLSNSNITIKSSSVLNNGTNGIFSDGTSSAIIGDDPLFACNLYQNQVFDVYNNSVNNINARYNYWGSMDSTFIAMKVYDKSDNSTKGRVYFAPFTQLPVSPNEYTSLSGTLRYSNNANSLMKNAAMVIKDFNGNEVASSTTNDAGAYSFGPFPSGSYLLDITPSDPWGGVNATDALAILNHFAQVSLLSGIPYAAANVNYSQSVNATDALFVMKRFAGLINDFPSGDYVNHVDSLFFENDGYIQNITTLCYGDVNQSYVPEGGLLNSIAQLNEGVLPVKSYSNNGLVQKVGIGSSDDPITLLSDGMLPIQSFNAFDLPVTIETGMLVGAVSLGFIYPDEFLELVGVEFSDGSNNHYFAACEGLVKIAWCDLKHLQLEDGALLLNLKMKALDLKNSTGEIQLGIYPGSELADHNGLAARDVVLKVPALLTSKTALYEYEGLAKLQLYPNPSNGMVYLNLSLREAAKVQLEVYNLAGQCQMRLPVADLTVGSHQLLLDATKLRPGVYQLRTKIYNGATKQSDVRKMLISF